MKKLFTLIVLLTSFMGAKAEWVEDYKIDYSSNTGFPFYVMGYVPEWVDGVMTDYGANYRYATQEELDGTGDPKWKDGESSVGSTTTQGGVEYQKVTGAGPYWHQYFIADGIKTELDGTYTIKAMVKASEPVTINVNMGWGWGEGQSTGAQVPIGTDWAEVEWEYSGIGGTSCNLVAQPGTSTATIEWKWVTVSHDQRPQRPTTWQEWLTKDGQPRIVEGNNKVEGYMGDAETPWEDPTVKFNDQEKNYLICAWGKEREVNMNEEGGWDPFPATIEQEANGNHYFIVHGKAATTEGDPSAWDNQFWIQSPQEWKSGTQLKIHFRYKASKTVTVATQCHKQNPSDYLVWYAIGDVNFTEEWQDFDTTITIDDSQGGTWSVAFQLNQNDKEAIDFYFDDLSWQSMVLDEGLFVAAANTTTGVQYDYDNAIEFTPDPEDEELVVATVGTVGKQNTWVNEVMISTIRGNDAAFKGATIKPTFAVADGEWGGYQDASLAKIKLPAEGVWKISIAPATKEICFDKLEGGEDKQPIDIKPNPTLIVVDALERDDLVDENNTVREEEGGTGQPWDNQFWIQANRVLDAGESTIVQFKYKSSIPANVSTQSHAAPGEYIHHVAIGNINFTEEWQDFEQEFIIPNECAGKNMRSIAFNMAEIRSACKYEIKDVVWKLSDNTETLINETGSENFFSKVVGGAITMFDDGTGISSVVNNNTVSTETYNLAGQRVSKDYKGIVIKNGKKVVNK